jgi:hypothetical protein
MRKIITGDKLKDLSGKEIDLTVGTALSNILVSAEAGGKMKMFTLAQRLFNDKAVEVDEADFNLIKTSVESTKTYTILAAGQLLVILENIKDEKPS